MAPGVAVRQADLWSRQRAELGEGPRWDRDRERLLWVDITAGQVLASDTSGTERLFELPGRASAVLERRRGGLLVAGDTDLVLLDAQLAVEGRLPVEDPDSGRVLNDADCDASGRLWIGSAVPEGAPPTGQLFRVDAKATAAIRNGISMSNGIGWSPDNRRIYTVDTHPPQRIDLFPFDLHTGRLGARRVFAHVNDGLPDGLAVDVHGCVWVAIWGSGEVRRFDPAGRLVARVRLPTSQPSSCAFGGPGLRDLYITTARLTLIDPDAREPLAGSIFVLPDAGEGLPSNRVAL